MIREKRAQSDSGQPKSADSPSRRTTLILLASLTLLFALGLVVAVLFASVAPLVFDKPGSEDDPRAGLPLVGVCLILLCVRYGEGF